MKSLLRCKICTCKFCAIKNLPYIISVFFSLEEIYKFLYIKRQEFFVQAQSKLKHCVVNFSTKTSDFNNKRKAPMPMINFWQSLRPAALSGGELSSKSIIIFKFRPTLRIRREALLHGTYEPARLSLVEESSLSLK
jgi:hypothetical protein